MTNKNKLPWRHIDENALRFSILEDMYGKTSSARMAKVFALAATQLVKRGAALELLLKPEQYFFSENPYVRGYLKIENSTYAVEIMPRIYMGNDGERESKVTQIALYERNDAWEMKEPAWSLFFPVRARIFHDVLRMRNKAATPTSFQHFVYNVHSSPEFIGDAAVMPHMERGPMRNGTWFPGLFVGYKPPTP